MTIYSSDKAVPYVYICTHKDTNQFYIGYRMANVKLNIPSHLDLPEYKTSSTTVRPDWSNYTWTIVAEFFGPSDAYTFEQQMIFDNWDNPLMLNGHCNIGKNQFRNNGHTQKTKDKIKKSKTGVEFSDSHKENIRLNSYMRGKPGPHAGKSLTDSHKNNLKLNHVGMTGKTQSEETKKKQSDAKLGKQLSDSHCESISRSKTGDKHPNYGTHRTESTKQSLRQSNIKTANLRRQFSLLHNIPYKQVTKKLPSFIIFISAQDERLP
jgi:hypothetical protein